MKHLKSCIKTIITISCSFFKFYILDIFVQMIKPFNKNNYLELKVEKMTTTLKLETNIKQSAIIGDKCPLIGISNYEKMSVSIWLFEHVI